MPNPAYHEFVLRVLDRPRLAGKTLLRVGSPDLDFTLRLMANANNAARYVGVDFEFGSNAGKSCRVEDLLAHLGPNSFDLLVCSEMLQHVEDWRLIIRMFKRIIRPHGCILITTRSLALPAQIMPRDVMRARPIERASECADPGAPTIFRTHELAHALLDGLTGLEIGPASHNPFGLRTRNVALPEGYEFYAEHQRREMGVEPAPVDIWASADNIPVSEASEDFIISSHVVEHLPNLVAAFLEWDRIVRDGGYVFMIVPLKGALAADEPRELTPFAHFVEDAYLKRTLDTHPLIGVAGGRAGHYHTFTPDSLLQVIEWMRINRFCEWELAAREDIDRKVGNGFTLAFKVRHTTPRAEISLPNWRYELSDMEAIFSDFEIVTLEADPSEPGVFVFAEKPVGFQERDLEDCPLFSVTANRRISALRQGRSDQPTGESKNAEDLYDKRYYDTYKSASGLPYTRTEPWLNLFAGIADKIVHEMNPRRVLDVGCAKGFLVEALRDRGVEAFGLDISEYAISECREDIRPYCWVASALDPFPLRYDLIVCIEVLEHLRRADAELAVANLCKHADDIVFSSTPDDFAEYTHVNVQPSEYWAERFARHGFYRDVDFDASFIAEHAIRFRRVNGPVHSVIRAYERRMWMQLREGHALRRSLHDLTLGKQQLESRLADAAQERARLEADLSGAREETHRLSDAAEEAQRAVQERDRKIEHLQISGILKESRIRSLQADLEEIHSGLGWTILSSVSRTRNRWLPSGSRRRAFFDAVVRRFKHGTEPSMPDLAPEHHRQISHKAQPDAPTKLSAEADGVSADKKPTAIWGSRILMISGSNGDMERYRCYHAQEQLRLCGLYGDVFHMTDIALPHVVPDYDLMILHRVPYSESTDTIVKTARSHHLSVLFDIDDLVFDPEVTRSIDALRWMDPDEQALYLDGVRRYQRTLQMCDAALVTTDDLAQAVTKAGRPAWVHRNALSMELIELSEEAVRIRQRPTDKIVIGYASGTRTHNRDFKEVEAALEQIFQVYPHAELWILGYLDLDEQWTKWTDRVKHIPFQPWRTLPNTLAQMDINLAPLETGSLFCMAKSELKYIEAAAVGVPTVASRVGAFEFAIRHGENGMLAHTAEDWFHALECLITGPTLRMAMGERARSDVLQRYHPSTRGAELVATLNKIVETLHGTPPRFKCTGPERTPTSHRFPRVRIFKEHELAHTLLDRLVGLEIGAGAHNPFGLRTRNVALREGYEFYAAYQRHAMGVEPASVDIWAPADNIPVPNASEDFVISSHVVQHLPNVIGAFLEWDRIVRDGGYVFMIVPPKGVLSTDESRELTTLAHFVEDYHQRMTLDTHPTAGVPGGRMGHYHTFTPESLLDVVEWMRQNRSRTWELVAREDVDSKVGNGFTLVFKVRHLQSLSDLRKPD